MSGPNGGAAGGADPTADRQSPWRAKARLTAYRALRVAGSRVMRAFPDYYEFYPEVRNALEFADLSARVACYMGDVEQQLFLPGPRFPLDPDLVPYFDPALVRDPGWVSERPSGAGHLVVHRLTPASIRRMASSRDPFSVVDLGLFTRSEEMYFRMRTATTWPTYAPAEDAVRRLRALAGKTAFIQATGPSATTVDVKSIEADVRITCNSAVRDLDRIRDFKPNIICFTDPVFHFGPSRYAAAFRRDAVRAAEEVDALVVCGHSFVGGLLGLEPGLRDRLCVLPNQDGGPWRWPTERNPTVRQAGNVLTTLMLPLALMLADEVAIAGADGRQPTETYFWRHNPKLQYSGELMQTVFDSHPAFFRDRDYVDYYDQFCGDVEDLIQLGERHGKTVRAAAPSWIPALTRRGAPEPVAGG